MGLDQPGLLGLDIGPGHRAQAQAQAVGQIALGRQAVAVAQGPRGDVGPQRIQQALVQRRRAGRQDRGPARHAKVSKIVTGTI
ncbi:hypothetical protein D3C87_2054660 [compost metagenome]